MPPTLSAHLFYAGSTPTSTRSVLRSAARMARLVTELRARWYLWAQDKGTIDDLDVAELLRVARNALGSDSKVLAFLDQHGSGGASSIDVGDGMRAVTDGDSRRTVVSADWPTIMVAEDTSGSPPALGSDGTALMLMPDSGAGPIVALIAGAQTSIDLEIYQLQSPAVIAALAGAQARGVAVRVMLEPKTVGAQNYAQAKAQLTAAGISVQPTPPAFDSSHNVDHAKFMVLDGTELVHGSGNMVRSGLGGNRAGEFDNRDFWIRDTRAAVVAEAQQVFAADWARTSTASTTFDHLVLTPDNAAPSLLELIDSAKERLYVYNQSLNDAATLDHLAAAQQRGVAVHVLLGMQPGFGGAPPANQPAIDHLTGAGATAQFFTTHYLHGKVIVADGKAFVGSQNFTSGGLKNNRELGEIVTSKTVVDSRASGFTADEANPAP